MEDISDDKTGLELEDEIAQLEARLAEAKQRLGLRRSRRDRGTETETATGATTTASSSESIGGSSSIPTRTPTRSSTQSPPPPSSLLADPSYHHLLLLSDSALPLGSFAFSSGLESYIAHARPPPPSSSSSSVPYHYYYKPTLSSFLPLSLSSYASTNLPFCLAAFCAVVEENEKEKGKSGSGSALAEELIDLDDALDASIVCAVGRRASTAQGRALLSIWEKSLCVSVSVPGAPGVKALQEFSTALRGLNKNNTLNNDEEIPASISAHLAPLFGAVAACLGLSAEQTAYVFLLSHAKALVSAAVRAGLFGPYQAQRVLAGADVQRLIAGLVDREWRTPVEEAAQSVPVIDLWVGRHEMLYSRIFNS
ncbi:UreF-domain-containing protein [Xylariaceae sp. FL0594]|nr:UreF-domain-containing protein [Xylariaceae sp. FL0594]